MKVALVALLVLCAGVQAQTVQQPQAPSANPVPAASISPKLHVDTLRLVEESGARKRLLDQMDHGLGVAEKVMMDQCPKCTQAFGDEWAKRMKQRYPLEEFLAAYTAVYERYLTDDDVLQLIALQKAANAGTPGVPPAALTQRLDTLMPTILNEISGRCAQIGAKIGAEIGLEIQKEHPEYLGLQGAAENKN
jgi:hypothetical protein